MENRTLLHLYPMPDDRVTAFSTTRHGGCGSGAYATFNCTPYVGDGPAVVRANQEQLCKLLGISLEKLIIPYQTHSSNILTIEGVEKLHGVEHEVIFDHINAGSFVALAAAPVS